MLKNCIQYVRERIVPISAVTISSYALYLRVMYLKGHTLWADEYHQLRQMHGSFLDLLKSLPKYEFCAYLSGDFYLTYPFFKMFSFNRWGLAIPHIIVTVIGFYFLYLLCKQYFKTLWGYLVTFLIVCFNATMIQHATEIRIYAVLPTLSLMSLYFSLMVTSGDGLTTTKRKVAFACFFIALIWFHVYGIGIFAVSMLFSVFLRSRDKDFVELLKRLSKFVFVILCITMPLWLFSVFGPHFKYRSLELDMFQFIPNPLVDPAGFLKGIFGNLVGFKKFYPLLIGVFFPFIFSYEKRLQQVGFFLIMILLPVTLVFLSDVRSGYWFVQRQFIWVMPLFAFFLGWTWDSLIMHIQGKGLFKKKI